MKNTSSFPIPEVSIVVFLSTGGTTTIRTLEGPGKMKDCRVCRSRNTEEGEFETFFEVSVAFFSGCLCWWEQAAAWPGGGQLIPSLTDTRATVTCAAPNNGFRGVLTLLLMSIPQQPPLRPYKCHFIFSKIPFCPF